METEKLYYQDPYLREFTATVLTCEPAKNGFYVTLDRTAFYPEGGGQPADRGTLGGAAVWQTLENGLNMIGAQVGIQRIVIGVIVVFAVLLDVVFRRGIFSRKTTKKTNELPAGVQK